MANRALLIGSQTGGLSGCHGDVALMAQVLGEWGFTSTIATEGDATRAAILAGYRALIDATEPGDAAVVYYSGHGGRFRNMTSINETTNAYWQFIVPTDMDASSATDFRGVLAEELRTLQLELSLKTDNVTTILDCCHSGLMSRDPAIVARFLNRPWPAFEPVVRARWDDANRALQAMLRSDGLTPDDAESNQRAVRLVACLPTESAFEMPTPESDGTHGLLTAGFALLARQARAEPATPVTWDDLARAFGRGCWAVPTSTSWPRGRRDASCSRRRPAVPHEAGPWTSRTASSACQERPFFGLAANDRVRSSQRVRSWHLGRRSRRPSPGSRAAGPCSPSTAPAKSRPSGQQRWPTRAPSQRRDGPWSSEETTCPEPAWSLPSMRRARVEATDDPTAPIAQVEVGDAGVALADPAGMPLYDGRPVDTGTLTRLVADLEAMAKVAVLREPSPARERRHCRPTSR